MAKTEYKNYEPLSDEEQEEIGRLISEGCTSGRLDSENGNKVAWQLNWNKWEEKNV